MRQQINLYEAPAEHNPWQDWYPIPQIGIGLVLLLVVLYALALFERADLKEQLVAAQQQFETRQSEFDRLKMSLPGAELDPNLQREVKDMTAELAGKQEMLRTINLKQADKQQGFSNFLEGLARRTMPGLWLTHIELNDGGARIGLQGQAAKPEFVPQLIKSLASEQAYFGKEFDVFNLSRDTSQGYLAFELRASKTGR